MFYGVGFDECEYKKMDVIDFMLENNLSFGDILNHAEYQNCDMIISFIMGVRIKITKKGIEIVE